jgi:polyphenol oxidase
MLSPYGSVGDPNQMWVLKDDIFYDSEFPFFHFVTIKCLGDMKDKQLRDRACSLKGVDNRVLVCAEQVHGSYAALVGINDAGTFVKEADGLVTAQKNISLAMFTADCIPVLLGAKGKACGIVHAGWRGLFKGIIPDTVKLFKKELGISTAGITASIGPHICAGCYTIGDEIRRAFGLSKTDANFDLAREAVSQLMQIGITDISVSNNCTKHETDLFFSYRKDKTPARIMSLVRF